MSRPSLLCALVAALALSLTSAARAAEPKQGPPADPSPETRQQMAAVHQKMADCLRSDRPFAECRSEMMKSCHDMMGEGGCPTMGGPGMMGPGMMQGGSPPPEPTPPKK